MPPTPEQTTQATHNRQGPAETQPTQPQPEQALERRTRKERIIHEEIYQRMIVRKYEQEERE